MAEYFRYILFFITIFISNTIQVITGFAGAMLAMPPSIRLIGVGPAKAIVSIVSGASCVYVAVRYWRNINKKELLKILALMGIGMYTGIRLFYVLKLDILLKIYGVIIILIALKKLFVKKEIQMPPAVLYLCLVMAGMIHGMFISGGSFLVVYAVWALHEKQEFRATVSAIWVVLNSFLLYDHYQAGYFTAQTGRILVISVLPFLMAVWLGNQLVQKISAEKFLLLTYILLLASGAVAVL